MFSCGSKEQAEPGVPTPLPTPKPTAKNALLDWEPVPRPHDKVIIGYCKCIIVFGWMGVEGVNGWFVAHDVVLSL